MRHSGRAEKFLGQKMGMNVAQYNEARPDGPTVRVATYQRKKMYQAFLQSCAVAPADTILDVGATSDQSYASSNYLEAWYPHKNKVTAAGIDDASFLETLYAGMTFVQANGLDLPFDDGAFDVVHSSAVLEHVGGFENQMRFISELARVAKKAAFLTTPNRWFPVEFHTILPLVHWLPKRHFRKILTSLGKDFFAKEENLNLMTPADVARACANLGLKGAAVKSMPLCGWPANILLTIKKDAA